MALRSFGGGELRGDKLARLVYFDEAGIANPEQEPFVAVAGIIVHGDHQLRRLRESLVEIMKRHIPAAQQDGFVFHAKELFNGGGKVFARDAWPIEKRLAIAREIADLPLRLNLKIVDGAIERAKFPEEGSSIPRNLSPRDKVIAEVVTCFLGCLALVERWMRMHAKNEHCVVVWEDNQDARKLMREVQNMYQDQRMIEALSEDDQQYFPLTHIAEDPLFQPKKPSSPLELADFCAYVGKRMLMNEADERYRPFLARFGEALVRF